VDQLTPDKIAYGLTAYVVLLFSLSVHESAHGWVAWKMGDDTAMSQGRVTLNPISHIDPVGTILMPLMQFLISGAPFLAWAKPTPVGAHNFRKLARGHVLVAGAGPTSNWLLVVLFTIVLLGVVKLAPGAPRPLIVMLGMGVQLNVALALFNLLPVPPLDGSWIASWGLPRNLAEKYDRVVEPLGGWLLLLLLVPIGRVLGPVTQAITQVLYGLVR
jgi:Zn-dependent protease